MRMRMTIATFVGTNQQGGQTDPRYMTILQSDIRGMTIKMGLTIVESNADAMCGFDGGRHAQVLLQLHVVGLTTNDWLLKDSLLTKYTMIIQH